MPSGADLKYPVALARNFLHVEEEYFERVVKQTRCSSVRMDAVEEVGKNRIPWERGWSRLHCSY